MVRQGAVRGSALPQRENSMCQSFTSVPRTYIRAADELEPLSPGARLASLPTLGPFPSAVGRVPSSPLLFDHNHYYRHPSLTPPNYSSATRFSPNPLPPKALPPALMKSLRPAKIPSSAAKNLDDLAPLGTGQEKQPPGTGLFGKCVLCLLLNAIFVLALFLAFLIGHFAAEAHISSNKTNNASSSASFPSAASVPVLIKSPSVSSQMERNQQRQEEDGENFDEEQKHLREMEFKKNVERNRQRIPSLREVYPPQFDSESAADDPWNDEEPFPALMLPSHSSSPYQLANGPVVHRSMAVPGPDIPLIPLPSTIVPRHYNVDLDFTEFYGVLEAPQFRGNLSILLEAFGNGTNDELVFHAATNIFIQRIRLFRQTELGKTGMEVKSVKRHTERDLIRLVLGERIRAGWFWLDLEFRTRICQSDQEGAHCFPAPSSPTQSSIEPNQVGEEKRPPTIAGFATKFEPNFARTFLPGWDEPRFRSTFNVSIRHFSDCRILTNTAPLQTNGKLQQKGTQIGTTQQSADALIRVSRFMTTPPMPLYLLAFATGPFSPLEVRTSRGNLTMNVWTAQQDILSAQFVANFSPAMFDRLQEDFGVRYPLSKMDIFLTPKFPVGGMENWGLMVLHSETVRLSNAGDVTLPMTIDQSANSGSGSASSSREERLREQQQQTLIAVDRLAEQYRVEKVITHELVHQWFGNLVSVWDWEELWLSEGFASYFVFDFLNAINHPHLTEHEYYLRLIELINRQSSDARSALVRPLRNARQLDRLFDGIQLYTKGAVMVKMLKDLIGPAEFRVGIARFLRENSFQSVDRRAVWAAFPTHADHGADSVRLNDVMEPWLLNKGMPEVEITRSYEDQSVRVEQRQADRNRHLVYLDDEQMQRMRLGMDEEERRRRRVKRRTMEGNDEERGRRKNKRRRRRTLAEQGELYAEREEATRHDIDGILVWMAEEFDAIDDLAQKGNGSSGRRKMPKGRIGTTKTTQKPFDDSLFWQQSKEEEKPQTKKVGKKQHQERRRHKGAQRWKKFGKKQKETNSEEEAGGEEDEEYDGTIPLVFSLKPAKRGRESQAKLAVKGEEEGIKRDNGKIRYLPSPSSDDPAKRRQLRAQKEKNNRAESSVGPIWPIPFGYSFGSVRSPRGQTLRQFWLLNDTVRFVDIGLGKDQFLLANPHWVYAYRVNYDQQNWRMLIAQLHKNHQEVPTMSRMQMIVDAECFLRESANPQLFVHLLSYLVHEDDLGVLLVGLDALHSLLELFSASDIFGPLLQRIGFGIIRQLDRQLALAAADGTDPELAALWLLSPLRLAKLYQLRCAANLGTCAESKQVRKWLAFPTALAAENHQQLAAICQHLFSQTGPSEVSLLSGLLKQSHSATFASVIRQLASRCVQDESLVRQAVNEILRTRNVVVYSSTLNNGYTIQYNRKFRELFWTGLVQQLNIHERQILFAVNTGKSDWMARMLLHSIRSVAELNLVERIVLHQWPDSLRVQMDYLRRKLSWTEREATEKIRKYLVEENVLAQQQQPKAP